MHGLYTSLEPGLCPRLSAMPVGWAFPQQDSRFGDMHSGQQDSLAYSPWQMSSSFLIYTPSPNSHIKECQPLEITVFALPLLGWEHGRYAGPECRYGQDRQTRSKSNKETNLMRQHLSGKGVKSMICAQGSNGTEGDVPSAAQWSMWSI